jgi:hypothetical protein
MDFTRIALSTATALLVAASESSATYQNLSVELHTTVNIDGVNRDIWRVYANFDDPLDQLTAVAGTTDLGTMTIQSRNFDDSDFGSVFYNVGASNQPPTQADIDLNPNRQWDTFATIGLSVADQGPFGDQMFFTPGFPSISGTQFSTNNGAWLATPTFDEDSNPGTPEIINPQTQAGFQGDNDSPLRILIAQLTTNAGGNVRGTVALQVRNGGIAPADLYPGQVFNSVPAPAAIVLLGMPGLAAARRRRR